jgi:[acyl-carrier-protein] S-malonyltransferase
LIAALFPGQGSQAVGMGRELLSDASGSESLAVAFATLPGLREIMLEGPAEQLQLTQNAQPALVAHSVAAFRAWRTATGLTPALAAGHSLGEFSALTAAGAIELSDALRLVRGRGRYMQQAVPAGEGAMAAVLKLEPEAIRQALEETEGVVEIANLNSPGQVVISGAAGAVQAAGERLRALGGRLIPLAVSAPFHSSLMKPARQRLERDLAATSISEAAFPVVSNVTAQAFASSDDTRRLLGEAVTSPVRWVDCVNTLWELGARTFVEFGPGTVLGGLVKRIVPEAATFSVARFEDINAFKEAYGG